MPTMSGSATLVANTRTANQLSGKIYEFLPYDAHVEIYAVTSGAGPVVKFTADSDVAVDDETINYVGTTINTSDHLVMDEDIAGGSRLNLTFLSSGTETVKWVVNITPLE